MQVSRRLCSAGLRAQALDVQLARGMITEFAANAMAMGQGGVGVYRRHSFVHIDCGQERHWGNGIPRSALRAAENHS